LTDHRVDEEVHAVCSLCRRRADPDKEGNPPSSWSVDMVETSEGHRPRWVCAACLRRSVRFIEAALERDWW
jgi:hypothetical protein